MRTSEPISSAVAPSVGRMVRAVGHDLRNKLGVMKNSIYYLGMKLGHDDAKVQRHLRIMEREIGNANRMIADLMDLVLLKKPVRQQGDVKAIVAAAVSEASLPDGLVTTIAVDDDLPPLMADAVQLQRAFTNIMLRITAGVPTGGELQIRASEQDSFVEVEFGCAGLIISEDNLAAAAAPLEAAGADGLGMIVSKILVEGHGGTIAVKRMVGKGAVFVVRLPLRNPVSVCSLQANGFVLQ